MRSCQVVADYCRDPARARPDQVGGLAAIIRTIEERIAAREWFMTPLWQPQYLNRVHRLRPLDDPRGVFPAGPGLVDREPRRVRAHPGSPAADPIHPRRRDGHGLRRQPPGVSMLQAARLWMEQHPDQVRAWLN